MVVQSSRNRAAPEPFVLSIKSSYNHWGWKRPLWSQGPTIQLYGTGEMFEIQQLFVSSGMKSLPCHMPWVCKPLTLHVKNNVEPDSWEVGARSPQDKHSSTMASLHHQNSFCWLSTQKTGSKKEIEKVGSRTMRKLGSQSKPKYRGTQGTWDQEGLSPHLLCWRKSSVHICLQHSIP